MKVGGSHGGYFSKLESKNNNRNEAIESGQIIYSDLRRVFTPNGGDLVREIPLFQGNLLGW